MALFAKWLSDNVGDSTTPITTDKADANFMGFYVSNSDATGGTARGMYMRLYLTGTSGQSGEAGRFFTTVNGTGAVGVHGVHASLSFGAAGTVTGQAAAMRNTLQVPNRAVSLATSSAQVSEIYCDGSSSDPSGSTVLSFYRAVESGNATGIGKVDTSSVFLSIEGTTIGNGKLVHTNTHATTHGLKILIGGVAYDILLSNAIA